MSVIEKSIEVDVPVRVAYDQWTQFEEFPRFMEGVEEIRQLDDTTLEWHVSIGGVDRSFRAAIEEQRPDERIAWRATEGQDQGGVVTFDPVAADRTRVNLQMNYEPDSVTEKVGDALNVIDRRVEGDLERFKAFIEDRGQATGTWRGEVGGGQTGDPADRQRLGQAETGEVPGRGGVGDAGFGGPAGGPLRGDG
jgi:uncharacterized membrane protein